MPYKDKERKRAEDRKRRFDPKWMEYFKNYSKQYREKNRDKFKEYDLKRDKVKRSARRAVHNAIKAGTMIKKTMCEKCPGRERVQAHHPDYSKPLDVIWLCDPCHQLLHHPLPSSTVV